jgi:hypothetical protein
MSYQSTLRGPLSYRRGIAGFGDATAAAVTAATTASGTAPAPVAIAATPAVPITMTYSAASDCTVIPAGDPYRVPGNQCTSGGVTYNFDANGNVVAVPGFTLFGLTPTSLAIGAVAGVALIMMLNKKGR